MTRIAIMSDVHGNFEALREVLADLDQHPVDAVFCLGDMIGYGPQPQECVDLLRRRKVRCTMGNHEQGLINIHYLRGFNQPAADVLRRTREMISEETFRWLISRPKSLVDFGCRFVHGLPPDSITEYLWQYREEMAGVFSRYGEDICFVGHTHNITRFTSSLGRVEQHPLPKGETVLEPGLRHLVNIGSVGQPRDGDNRAKYGLLDLETRALVMRFIPYDIKKTADLILAHGFHRGFADRLW